MKKLIVLLLAIVLLVPVLARADTFLTASISSVADGFIVTVDGTSSNVPRQVVTIVDRDGVEADYILLATVTGITQGNHSVTIIPYVGAWEGAPVPFDFTKPDVSALNLQLNSGTVK